MAGEQTMVGGNIPRRRTTGNRARGRNRNRGTTNTNVPTAGMGTHVGGELALEAVDHLNLAIAKFRQAGLSTQKIASRVQLTLKGS